MTLRPYQRTVVEAAKQALASHGSVVLQMPTGGGKTKAATAIVAEHGGGVWFVCHRREIIRQASAAFIAAGIKHGIIAPGHEQADDDVQIASVQTLARRFRAIRPPALVIWDECHHVAAKSWSAIREALPDALHLGLTATPERLDGKGLADWFAQLVCGPSIKSLVEEGWLTPMRYFAPSLPDLTAAKMQAGDYSRRDTAAIMGSPVLIGDAVAEYQKHTQGKRAIAFCASVEASKALVARFAEAGVPASHVDGTTSAKDRDAAVEALRSGAIKVLSNVEVFTEGFDLPDIDAAILLRPTKSLALFLQMVGRSLRPSEGKERAVIFDHAGLWLDHGRPDAEWAWSLDGGAREARLKSVREAGERLRLCPECKEVQAERVPICECGYCFPSGREIGEFDGVLLDIGTVPSGHETRTDFGKRVGVNYQTVDFFIKKGMPLGERGLVNIHLAMEWLVANPRKSMRPLFVKNPQEYEPRYKFAQRFGFPDTLVPALESAGLPCAPNGWVHSTEGVEWVKNNLEKYWTPRAVELPPGYATVEAFREISGIASSGIRTLALAGMPSIRDGNRNRYIDVAAATEWLKSRNSHRTAPIWEGDSASAYEPAESFAERLSIQKYFPRLKEFAGFPRMSNGWVHIRQGLEWVRDNTDIPIPTGAWPASNDNQPMEKAA